MASIPPGKTEGRRNAMGNGTTETNHVRRSFQIGLNHHRRQLGNRLVSLDVRIDHQARAGIFKSPGPLAEDHEPVILRNRRWQAR